MTITRPTRVWINQPSTLQAFHHMHGDRGIAIPDGDNPDIVRIFFCEGDLISMRIPTVALSPE